MELEILEGVDVTHRHGRIAWAASPINTNRPFAWRQCICSWIWNKVHLVQTDSLTLISPCSTGSQSVILLRNSSRVCSLRAVYNLAAGIGTRGVYQNDI